jgi:hypothetical protein
VRKNYIEVKKDLHGGTQLELTTQLCGLGVFVLALGADFASPWKQLSDRWTFGWVPEIALW